jgi:hypothetical protein
MPHVRDQEDWEARTRRKRLYPGSVQCTRTDLILSIDRAFLMLPCNILGPGPYYLPFPTAILTWCSRYAQNGLLMRSVRPVMRVRGGGAPACP